MSESTIVEWLNENSYRSYPLLEGNPRYIASGATTIDLNLLILDAALFYTAVPNDITLNSIQTSGGNLIITVAGQSVFTITSYASASYPKYVRNNEHSLLVIGDASAIPNGLTFTISGAKFESSVALEIYPATRGVSSITIDSHNLTGSVQLVDGYQLSFKPSGHTVNLEAGRNEGNPLPCGSFKGVTNDCSLVASFINGASPNKTGGTIKFVAGKHAKIFEDPNNNRIFIGFDFVDGDIQPPANEASVSYLIDKLAKQAIESLP